MAFMNIDVSDHFGLDWLHEHVRQQDVSYWLLGTPQYAVKHHGDSVGGPLYKLIETIQGTWENKYWIVFEYMV